MKLGERMKVSTKLTGGFAVVAVICALVGGVGWLGVNSLQTLPWWPTRGCRPWSASE